MMVALNSIFDLAHILRSGVGDGRNVEFGLYSRVTCLREFVRALLEMCHRREFSENISLVCSTLLSIFALLLCV